MKRSVMPVLVAGAALVLMAAPSSAAPQCDSLSALKLKDTSIVEVRAVTSGSFTPPGERARAIDKSAAVLRGARRDQTDAAVVDSIRSVAAREQLERRTARRRQRRPGRDDQLSGDGVGAARRLRDRQHRHRAHRDRAGDLARGSRAADRLQLSRPSSDDRRRESDSAVLLQPVREVRVLQRLLHRRQTGADGSAALSRGLRRHPGGRRRELLDAPDGQRSLERRRHQFAGDQPVQGEAAAGAGPGDCDVRRARRREGRPDQRSDALPLRSGHAAVRGRRCARTA